MAVFVQDTFSGESENVDLTAHTGEVGASWTVIFGYPSCRLSAASGTVYSSGTPGNGAYASGVPASSEYDVEADVSDPASTGIAGRTSTTATTFYHARNNGTEWQLYKFVSGTATLLGSYADSYSGTKRLKLQIRDAAKKVFVDGVERISSGDNSITDAGRAGIRLILNNTVPRIDNFLATDLSGGGSQVGSDFAVVYDIRAQIYSDFAAAYDIRQTVSSDFQTVYDIFTSVSSDFEARFNILASISSDFACVYDIRQEASGDFEVVFDMHQLASSDFVTLYDMGGRVDSDFEVVFDIKTQTVRVRRSGLRLSLGLGL